MTSSGHVSSAFAISSSRQNHFPSGVVISSASPDAMAAVISPRVHPSRSVACQMLTRGRGWRKM